MSDESATTTTANDAPEQTNVANQATNPTPNQSEPQQQTPNAGAQAQAAGEQPEEQEPFATFDTAESFNKRLERDAKKRMNKQAQELGFDSWEQMQTVFSARRQGDGEQPQAAPAADNRAERLQMALQVGQELNLPVALINRLQGDDIEAMRADAETLQGLFQPQQQQAGPGIPPAPQSEQRATFTRAQLQNPQFVRENKEAIMQAAREGRIVDS